jgi:hypothetical protein
MAVITANSGAYFSHRPPDNKSEGISLHKISFDELVGFADPPPAGEEWSQKHVAALINCKGIRMGCGFINLNKNDLVSASKVSFFAKSRP